jgi:hypothetical protein
MISLASFCASGADRSTVLQVGSARRRGGCRLSAARQTTVRIGGSTGKSEWPLPGRRESSLEHWLIAFGGASVTGDLSSGSSCGSIAFSSWTAIALVK